MAKAGGHARNAGAAHSGAHSGGQGPNGGASANADAASISDQLPDELFEDDPEESSVRPAVPANMVSEDFGPPALPESNPAADPAAAMMSDPRSIKWKATVAARRGRSGPAVSTLIDSPDELAHAFSEYAAFCVENPILAPRLVGNGFVDEQVPRIPTMTGFASFLGVGRGTIESWGKDDAKTGVPHVLADALDAIRAVMSESAVQAGLSKRVHAGLAAQIGIPQERRGSDVEHRLVVDLDQMADATAALRKMLAETGPNPAKLEKPEPKAVEGELIDMGRDSDE